MSLYTVWGSKNENFTIYTFTLFLTFKVNYENVKLTYLVRHKHYGDHDHRQLLNNNSSIKNLTWMFHINKRNPPTRFSMMLQFFTVNFITNSIFKKHMISLK